MSPLLITLGLLLGCQLVGEIAARGLALPVPGPVIGLALLILLLWLRPAVADTARGTTAVILANLALVFVPAGVGVIGNLDVLSADWFALLVVLIASTLLAMLATVFTFLAVSRLISAPEDP
ncbi:MAG: CidA/LrgA family protein [Pseudomonadota bacterium]